MKLHSCLLIAALCLSARALSAAALTIPYPIMDGGTVGVTYSKTMGAAGGTKPYTWSISSGTLIPGVTLNAAKGTFSGSPTAPGEFKFTLTVTDAVGATCNAAEDCWIGKGSSGGSGSETGTGTGGTTSPAALTIPYPVMDPGIIGTAYSKTIAAAGGTKPYVYAISSGTAIPGIALNSATGAFTGTPTTGGDFKFTLTVTDAAHATVSAAEDVWIGGGSSSSGSGGGSGSGSGAGSGSGGGGSATYTLTVVNGVLNGNGSSGSFAAGTVVQLTADAAPAGQYFQAWSGANVANSSNPSTTLTMPAAPTAVTANFFAPPPIPQPVTGHPRIWITPNDVARLQSWAVPTNLAYTKGIQPVLNKVVNDYQTQFFPGGVANANYPDLGDTQGYQGLLTEEDAVVLAFNSLIDPSAANRATYAQDARNLIMYAMNQAVQGPAANVPFRDPLFAVYNRANANSQDWPLVVDWIYPVLSAQDKATIRQVFLLWASQCINASTTGGDHPSPVGVMNTHALLPNSGAYRMAANNYYLGHARLLTMMALALDPADDPQINPQLPDSALGNTLRSYINDATGAWLYQEFAMFGDPAAVTSAYNLPANASVGLASGGLPAEGMLYGHSIGFILGQLLALQTAGFNTPSLAGPQAALISAPVWGRFLQGFQSSMVPAAQVNPGASYLGPIYQISNYGDLLRLWVTPDFSQPFGLLALLDHQLGVHSHDDAVSWMLVNGCEGGAANLYQRMGQPYSWGIMDCLIPFMVLDPAQAVGADPRPNYPASFYDAPQGRLISHTDWSPNATMFDYRGSWISINHQDADGGMFQFYRKGEWLTKETSGYDSLGNGQASMWHNTLSIQNWSQANPPTLNWFEGPLWASGSQWQLGLSAGDPTTVTSSGAGYTFAQSDLTKLFNRPSQWMPQNALMDVSAASRSLLWINQDFIVVYDRATTLHAGFKRWNLSFVRQPLVQGNLLKETTPGGQNLFVQCLLPANPAINWVQLNPSGSTDPNATITTVAELEPTTGRIVVQDPSNPTDTRFLHVLQGADGGGQAVPATLVQSTAGTAFQGAAFGTVAAMFPVALGAAVPSVAYTVPASVTTNYVTGLVPGAGYTVTETAGGGGVQVTVTAGGSAIADSAGVLTF